MNREERSRLVKTCALELGFDAVGVTHLAPTPHGDQLRHWLDQGMAGSMRYMHRQKEHRLNPGMILPGAEAAVILAKDYFNSDPTSRAGFGRVAKYARGPDYHHTLAPSLERVTEFLKSLGNKTTSAKWYIDAGPVPERELAQRAGIGWIGKNTMLIDPTRGSYTFLASVLTDLDLATDQAFEPDRCGSCRRCLDACPTGAFATARVLDARRCISYLTIEHKGAVPTGIRRQLGTWVFGCDICQEVCPWNQKFARDASASLLGLEASNAYMELEWLAGISDQEFQRALGHTPFERPGPSGIRRNARVALENLAQEAPCQTS